MISKNIFIVFLSLTLGACGTVPLHSAVPKDKVSQTVVEGYSANIRSWGDQAPENLDDVVAKRITQYKAAHQAEFEATGHYPPMEYLALSGGGNDGAFGAGLLNGWTKSGTRPQFAIVTGVSTGALIAPFAFLGSDYDDELKELYTTLKSENIFIAGFSTILDGITGGLALTDNGPLFKKIEESVTKEMFDKIAAEHRKGRRLLIATTNVEAQRSVIWDMGSIANSGRPDALKLFHKIMLASSAIPGAFAPVFIDVTVDGKEYSEIHSDGGVTAQVFLYPLQSTSTESRIFKESGIERKLFVVRNTKITPEYKELDPGLLSLSERSVETLIKYQGVGDLYRLYVGAKRDGIDYNLIQVPETFQVVSKEMFDPEYMGQIFKLGYDMGVNGVQWTKSPPYVEYTDDNVTTKDIKTPMPAQ
ncbi:MAG: patatin [Micavibrio aeruginosavorus]|uniref:Patatin n=1 Tax=Micavibrio aeruginosavorus TaxID=349221 RepID=A0A2W5Q1U4_9BACT|nr:MAG: patatin [Micavibrio aeruginosavorus]